MRKWTVMVNGSFASAEPPGPGVHTCCSLSTKVVRLRALYELSKDVNCKSASRGDCVSCTPSETR